MFGKSSGLAAREAFRNIDDLADAAGNSRAATLATAAATLGALGLLAFLSLLGFLLLLFALNFSEQSLAGFHDSAAAPGAASQSTQSLNHLFAPFNYAAWSAALLVPS